MAKADWLGLDLDRCNFKVKEITPLIMDIYNFLENFSGTYRVVRLDHHICEHAICRAHIDNTYLYRDAGHLSREGSAALGRKHGFLRINHRRLITIPVAAASGTPPCSECSIHL
jgi:hypothetical protein